MTQIRQALGITFLSCIMSISHASQSTNLPIEIKKEIAKLVMQGKSLQEELLNIRNLKLINKNFNQVTSALENEQDTPSQILARARQYAMDDLMVAALSSKRIKVFTILASQKEDPSYALGKVASDILKQSCNTQQRNLRKNTARKALERIFETHAQLLANSRNDEFNYEKAGQSTPPLTHDEKLAVISRMARNMKSFCASFSVEDPKLGQNYFGYKQAIELVIEKQELDTIKLFVEYGYPTAFRSNYFYSYVGSWNSYQKANQMLAKCTDKNSPEYIRAQQIVELLRNHPNIVHQIVTRNGNDTMFFDMISSPEMKSCTIL